MTEEQLANQPVEYYKNGKPKPPKKPVKAKPRTGSLFKSMTVDAVTLDEALQLMSLPRVLGEDAEGNPITVQNGRFGPYLKKGTDSRSIGSEEEIFTITLEQALEIYSQPKQRGARAAVPPLGRVRSGPGVGEEHRGEGGPLRPVHHRRHHQHHRAPRHCAGGTDPGTRRRTPRRKAGKGPGQAHHTTRKAPAKKAAAKK
jgi:DNA topoisomerase-1